MVISQIPITPIRYKQKGIREYLLCQPCETRISRWERYMKEVIYDDKHARGGRVGEVVVVKGLDYTRSRLYHLSLLWRMGITSEPMFASVSLGPQHEELLRNLLNQENPGAPTDYPFFAFIPTILGKIHEDLISQPEWIRVDGHRLYRVVIGGILYFFGVNSGVVRPEWQPSLLTEDGTWQLLIGDIEKIPFLSQWCSAVAKADRIRENERNLHTA